MLKFMSCDSFSRCWGEWVVKWRWLIVLASIIVTIAMTAGAAHIGFSNNYRIFFGKDNPQLVAFEAMEKVYTKADNIIFTVVPNDGEVFTPQTLTAIQELTEKAWQIPNSTRVDSVTNFQHTYAEGDELVVEDLVEGDPAALSPQQLAQKQEVAVNEPLLINRIISPQADATGVNVTVYLEGEDPMEAQVTAQAARDLIAEVAPKYPELTIKPSGTVMMNAAFMESSMQDMMTLMPIMFALLMLMLFIFLRSVAGTLITMVVIGISAATAMGFAGYMGIKLTPVSATAPTIILTLAIADSVHVLITMLKEMAAGRNRRDAIVESMRVNLQPVFLTSLTTIIGFLALNFSDAPPFHHLGNITAVGVGMAFLFSALLLPALLAIIPVKGHAVADAKGAMMDRLATFVINKRRILAPVMIVVVVGLGLMLPRMELNDEFVKYFDHSIDFRTDTEFMMDNLTGIYFIDYSLPAKDTGGVSSPEYLAHVDKFKDWLYQQPEVQHVYTISDIFKRLNKNLHGDDPDWYRLPENRNMAAQYLLLYEMSLPYGLDLNDRINIDKSATRISVTLRDDPSTNQVKDFQKRSEQWIRDNTPEYMNTDAVSPIIMFSYISEKNIQSMIQGNLIAFILISLSIAAALVSVRMGVYSLIPNMVPAVMAFGLWALFVGQINMAVAVVAAASLGIIVDDTVHFLSKYNRARREKGATPEEAVRYAFNTVGTALTVTTITLIIGFSVLAMSSFAVNSTMGLLTALAIGCALVADFLLLPPLLMMWDKRKGLKNASSKA